MVSTGNIQVSAFEGDEVFLPPVSAELLAARAAKRDYFVCLIVAMLTPVVMLLVASLMS